MHTDNKHRKERYWKGNSPRMERVKDIKRESDPTATGRWGRGLLTHRKTCFSLSLGLSNLWLARGVSCSRNSYHSHCYFLVSQHKSEWLKNLWTSEGNQLFETVRKHCFSTRWRPYIWHRRRGLFFPLICKNSREEVCHSTDETKRIANFPILISVFFFAFLQISQLIKMVAQRGSRCVRILRKLKEPLLTHLSPDAKKLKLNEEKRSPATDALLQCLAMPLLRPSGTSCG